MTARFDPTLCLVLGPEDCAGRDVGDVALQAVGGGATMVQLRWKDAETTALTALARRLVALLRPHNVPLIVNDRADIALAAGTAGVHVGQTDQPAGDARALLGPAAIIGLSVESAAQLHTVDDAAVDYVGLGPLFATPSKADHAAPLGLGGFVSLRRRIALPVLAIGGVKEAHAAELRQAGADGLAVVSAIAGAADPRAAAAALRRAFA
jgi:thiamine-phosphate pyrophosphorylase